MVVVVVLMLMVVLVVRVVILMVVVASLSWYSAQNQRQDNARVNPTAEPAREGGIAGARRFTERKNLFQKFVNVGNAVRSYRY